MALKIDRDEEGQRVVLSVSGRISLEEIPELESVVCAEVKPVVIDMSDVRLISQDAMSLISQWLSENVELRNCPAYVCDPIGSRRKKDTE